MKSAVARLSAGLSLVLVLGAAHAEQQIPPVKSEHVAGCVHFLQGAGGNIAVCAGDDGAFMIDDQYAPMAPKIIEALQNIDAWPLRFVLNTHWHSDHTGGNEAMSGEGALIIAHENVRKRVSTDQFIKAFGRPTPASPESAWPVVTYSRDIRFHLNGEEVQAWHVPAAHTDGDSIVYFNKADVLHMGDIFFNGLYPFIDASSGGRVNGVLKAIDRGLAVAGEQTQIIPGHGPITDRAGLLRYREMLQDIRDQIARAKQAGQSLEDIQASKPTAAWDEDWGGGFLKPDAFVAIVYDALD